MKYGQGGQEGGLQKPEESSMHYLGAEWICLTAEDMMVRAGESAVPTELVT